MLKTLLNNSVSPSEGEENVKIYHCTTNKSKIIQLNAPGFLEVTNKRLIYQAQQETKYGKNIIHSEVPIADVSGIKSSKGNYFNISYFVLALLMSFFSYMILSILIETVGQIYPKIGLNMIFGGILVALSLAGSFFVKRGKIWKTILAASAFTGLTPTLFYSGINIQKLFLKISISKGFGSSLHGIFGSLLLLAAFGIFIYILICAYWYAMRQAFSLTIFSKGGSSAPVRVSSITSFGSPGASMDGIMSTEPAVDSEQVIHELGAVILDIQTLGDLGIKKWKKASKSK